MKVIARALTLVALTAALAPTLAQAAEPEKVVVRNRKFSSDGKFEVGVNVGVPLATYLTDHYNFNLNLDYNLTENWAIELGGGYAYSRHTSVADAASQTIVKDNPTKSAKIVDDFSDLWQMTWSATGAIRWTPIYGKLNVAAELPLHFQFFLLLGGGAGGMKRDSLVYCVGSRPSSGAVTCGNGADDDLRPLHQEEVKPLILGGFGMRLFLTQAVGIRIEVRDEMFPDSFREKIDRAAAEGDTAANEGSAPAQGTPSANPGFTHLVFANIGIVFSF